MKWITCEPCDTEFRVISETDNLVSYCPYCGCDVYEEIKEYDESEDE